MTAYRVDPVVRRRRWSEAQDLTITVEERFWSKVDKSGPVPESDPEKGPCWLWTGGRNDHGYGAFRVRGESVYAHRHALALALGRPLAPGMVARHVVCDNPPCVNPAHLAEGTQAQNMQDATSHDRHPAAKLSNAQVGQLRARAAEGLSQRAVGREFGVSKALVQMILAGKVRNAAP